MLKQYWQKFLRESGQPEDTVMPDSCFFGMNEAECGRQLGDVLAGKKTAMLSLAGGYRSAQREANGEKRLIVTGWDGSPACIVELKTARELPLDAVTADMARADAPEMDYEAWLENRGALLRAEAEELQLEFSPAARVCFETFELLSSETDA